ncbi:MAG: helix-turn-helix domain-containing protein [Bacteroidales bacterium]
MTTTEATTGKSNSFSTTFDTWLSSEQVCALLRISVRTLVSYRQRNILPFSQIGRKIYYKASDINDYLERHYIKARYQEGGVYGK